MKSHVKTVKNALMPVIRSKGVKKPIGNVINYRSQNGEVQKDPERMAKSSTFCTKMYRKTCLLVYARTRNWAVFGVLGVVTDLAVSAVCVGVCVWPCVWVLDGDGWLDDDER